MKVARSNQSKWACDFNSTPCFPCKCMDGSRRCKGLRSRGLSSPDFTSQPNALANVPFGSREHQNPRSDFPRTRHRSLKCPVIQSLNARLATPSSDLRLATRGAGALECNTTSTRTSSTATNSSASGTPGFPQLNTPVSRRCERGEKRSCCWEYHA